MRYTVNDVVETSSHQSPTEGPEAVLRLQEFPPPTAPKGSAAADPAVVGLFYSLFCWTKWT